MSEGDALLAESPALLGLIWSKCCLAFALSGCISSDCESKENVRSNASRAPSRSASLGETKKPCLIGFILPTVPHSECTMKQLRSRPGAAALLGVTVTVSAFRQEGAKMGRFATPCTHVGM